MPPESNLYGGPLAYDPSFHGPVQKRHCTDVLCLGIFIVFIIGWVSVGSYAFANGKTETVFHPTDSYGRVCGRDASVQDKPYLLHFDITQCITPSVVMKGCQTPQVCVSECPSETIFAYADDDEEEAAIKRKLYCKSTADKQLSLSYLVTNLECPSFQVKSVEIAGYCIPSLPMANMHEAVVDINNREVKTGDKPLIISDLAKSSEFLALFLKTKQVVDKVIADLILSWQLVLVCLGIALGVTFIYLCLMYFMGKVLIVISLIGSFILLGIGFFCACLEYLKDEKQDKPMTAVDSVFKETLGTSDYMKYIWLAAMIIFALGFLVLIVIFVFVRQKIFLAITMVEEASKAVAANAFTLLFPVFLWALEIIILMYGFGVGVLLASGGKPQYRASGLNSTECACEPYKDGGECNPIAFQEACGTTDSCNRECRFVKYGSSNIVLHFYNFIGVGWCSLFATHFAQISLAGTFATWYWTMDKKTFVIAFPLLASCWRVIRYHIGTVALGSFLVATTALIVNILVVVEQQTRKGTNAVIRALFCWCICCLWLFENFLRYISAKVYIGVAIHGENFFTAAVHEFHIFMRNMLQIAVLHNVATFLLFFGKLLMVGTMALISFYLASEKMFLDNTEKELTYIYSPVILVAVGTYFIASIFISVFVVAINTIFHCFLEDRERNNGSPERPYYMSQNIRKLLERSR